MSLPIVCVRDFLPLLKRGSRFPVFIFRVLILPLCRLPLLRLPLTLFHTPSPSAFPPRLPRGQVEQLLKRQPTGRVIATCRDPMGAQHLDALHDQSGGRLDVMQLDVTKEDTIEAVAAAVRQKYGKLDLLLNVAGVLHRPNELQPESSLHWLCQDAMLLAYRVNAMGPMLVLK
ncbi:unnamed protein product, partial [Closterium sp. NIES-53]